MSDASIPAAVTAASPTGITIWPADVLARHLASADANIRMRALGMALQPDAPVSECVEALLHAAMLNREDPLALSMTAAVMGSVRKAAATVPLVESLATLAHRDLPVNVRTAATHALVRHACMPATAAPEVAMLLLADDTAARQIALHALTPFARNHAAQIAAAVASVTPEKWTNEALAALARSAKEEDAARRTVEDYVVRSLAGQPIAPTGIAGYVALAELNNGGAGLAALAAIVREASAPEHLVAALNALGGLGGIARPVARDIAARLVTTDEFALEELLCRTLVQIQAVADDIPLPRVVSRIGSAPDQNVVPHCMLLTLHPKAFASAGVVIKKRFEVAAEPLKGALALAYRILTKMELTGGAAAAGS
jgi:hypothetical protein